MRSCWGQVWACGRQRGRLQGHLVLVWGADWAAGPERKQGTVELRVAGVPLAQVTWLGVQPLLFYSVH